MAKNYCTQTKLSLPSVIKCSTVIIISCILKKSCLLIFCLFKGRKERIKKVKEQQQNVQND